MTLENQALHLENERLATENAGLRAEVDEVKARAAGLEQGLRDIEERLRLRTGPIREALQGLKDPAIVEAWKWAVYGSCIHAQLVLRRSATPGEGGEACQ